LLLATSNPQHATQKYPHGESNPGPLAENQVS
jgi:hypothetical protein